MVPPGGNIIESSRGFRLQGQQNEQAGSWASCLFSFAFLSFPVFSISGIFPQLFCTVAKIVL